MSDPWKNYRSFTQARIGLPRSGHSISTNALLEFQLAHAESRDAVHQRWDVQSFTKSLSEPTIVVESQVSNRDQFLKRPDLGRKLHQNAESLLKAHANELVFVISDGLSAKAIEKHAAKFWKVLSKYLASHKLSHAPLVLAPYSRVAIADPIGALMKAKLAVILIGERPGLSSNDSLGIYLTYNPKPGNHDANRNCISNVRPPDGLSYEDAAAKLIYLIKESLRLKLSGVNLKENNPALDNTTALKK